MALAIALLMACTAGFAQEISVSVNTPSSSGTVVVKDKVTTKDIEAKADVLSKNLELSLNNIGADLSDNLADIAPKIISGLSDLLSDVKVDVNTDGFSFSNHSDHTSGAVKTKSYTKSYPLDGNDRIKLNNQ